MASGLLCERAARPERAVPLRFEALEFAALCLLFTLLQTGLGGAAGAVVVAAEAAILVLLVVARWRRGARRLIAFAPLLAYPLFTVASTMWSLAPSITLRYSLELLFTSFVGLYLGLYRRPSEIVRIIFIATAVGLLASVASHRQGPSATGMVLIGLVGSKNAMAFLAQWAALSALAVLLAPRATTAYRLTALLILPPASFVTVHVHAAGATMTLYLGFAVLLALNGLCRSPAPLRYLTAGLILASALGAWLLRAQLMASAQDFMIHVLHKDLTLTGRTVLWDYARQFMARHPLLGRGYKEIWSGGGVDTEGLLQFAKITDGRGFYFHETYLDAGVDCGLVGILVLAATFLFVMGALSWRFLVAPSPAVAYFLTMFALLMMRSFGETLMQPLSPYCALIFCCAVLATRRDLASRPAGRRFSGGGIGSLALAPSPATPAIRSTVGRHE